ncbi:DNA-binding protein [Desulfocurvus vexinensis]|uniref:DNA-binding protein n=1 Tax=Desulfocurvus vexinensis TaxID=399548 RepID=UPI00054D4B00|nr:DNA-binding protein [Desulfocurvus vexinensis]
MNHSTIRTPEEVKAEFRRKGLSIAAWARQRGYSEALARMILNGDRSPQRGMSHAIAVDLGLKRGDVVSDDRIAEAI